MQALLARILTFILILQSFFGLIGEKYAVYDYCKTYFGY